MYVEVGEQLLGIGSFAPSLGTEPGPPPSITLGSLDSAFTHRAVLLASHTHFNMLIPLRWF